MYILAAGSLLFVSGSVLPDADRVASRVMGHRHPQVTFGVGRYAHLAMKTLTICLAGVVPRISRHRGTAGRRPGAEPWAARELTGRPMAEQGGRQGARPDWKQLIL